MASSSIVVETAYQLVNELVRVGESAVALEVADDLWRVLHEDDYTELRDLAVAGKRAERDSFRTAMKTKLGAAYNGPEPGDDTVPF